MRSPTRESTTADTSSAYHDATVRGVLPRRMQHTQGTLHGWGGPLVCQNLACSLTRWLQNRLRRSLGRIFPTLAN
eukprot:7053286-Pyramimonas_sp.AAC.1